VWSNYHGSYTWQSLSTASSCMGADVPGQAHRATADALAALGVLRALAALDRKVDEARPLREQCQESASTKRPRRSPRRTKPRLLLNRDQPRLMFRLSRCQALCWMSLPVERFDWVHSLRIPWALHRLELLQTLAFTKFLWHLFCRRYRLQNNAILHNFGFESKQALAVWNGSAPFRSCLYEEEGDCSCALHSSRLEDEVIPSRLWP
jgi:hypothetical protein